MTAMLSILSHLLFSGPLCHGHHFGGGGSLDPQTRAIVDASFAAMVVIFLCSGFMCVAGGPLVLVLTRKVRHLFWLLPAVNTIAYVVIATARPYPGGIWARFQMPGLIHMAIELFVLVVLSFGTAILLALLYLGFRMLRTLKGVMEGEYRQDYSASASTATN